MTTTARPRAWSMPGGDGRLVAEVAAQVEDDDVRVARACRASISRGVASRLPSSTKTIS